mgnify:FL=1
MIDKFRLIIMAMILLLPAGLSADIDTTDRTVEAGESSLKPVVGLELIAEGLVAPMGFVSAGDGRMFIVEQTGLIRVMQADGTILK